MGTRFSRIFPYLLVIITLAIHIFVSIAPANSLVNWFTIDDAYYYFKEAQHVSEGLGFTFDGINSASGFHPLWMFICIPVFALARFNLLLPLRILVIIAGILNAASGVLLFTTFRKVLAVAPAALLSFFWAISPLVQPVISHNGMEAGINAFATILFISLLVRYEMRTKAEDRRGADWKSMVGLGGAAVLVLFSRLDNIFLVAAAGMWLVYRQGEKRYPVTLALLLSVASVFVSFMLRIGFREAYIQYLPSIYWMLALSILLKMVVFALGGLFDLHPGQTFWKLGLRVVLAATTAGGLLGAVMLGIYSLGVFDRFPRTVILIDWGITLAGLLLITGLYRWLASREAVTGQPVSVWKQATYHLNLWRQRGSAFFAPVAAALILYMGWSKLTFGTFSPVSGQIKHWWGTLYTVYGKPVNSLVEFFGYDARLKRGPWSLALSGWTELAEKMQRLHWIRKDETASTVGLLFLALLAAFILLAAFDRQRFRKNIHAMALLPLAAGSLLQLFYYNGTGYVNTRDWYWISQMLTILWLAAVFTDLLYHRLLAWNIPAFIPAAVMVIFGAVWLGSYAKDILTLVPPAVVPENETAYLGPIQLLEQATEPGAVIGSTGGGNIAYFIQDRTIVNLDGLMNSTAYFDGMKDGTAAEFLNRMGMDYVFANAYMVTKSEPYDRIFAGRLTQLDTFANATLFRFTCEDCR